METILLDISIDYTSWNINEAGSIEMTELIRACAVTFGHLEKQDDRIEKLEAALDMSEKRFATLKDAWDTLRRRDMPPIYGSAAFAEEKKGGRIEQLETALGGAYSWIDRWVKHVPNCRAPMRPCTCGRDAVMYEASKALEGKDD